MASSNRNKLIEFWKEEEQHPFKGWDFSHLDNRMTEEQPPWSFASRAAVLMDEASALLELGTGGGERFLKLKDHWPERVVVTEEYPPNFRLAKQRLTPFGVTVVNVRLTNSDPMPFDDNEFDLILNRHSAFNTAEVARTLAPEGVFLTQQVHGLWAQDLLAEFGAKPPWPQATPDYYVAKLEATGLDMQTVQEWEGKLSFTDVGAIVYYLKAVPWLVPEFSVETHLESLLRLQARLEQGRALDFSARQYLIEAHQPV